MLVAGFARVDVWVHHPGQNPESGRIDRFTRLDALGTRLHEIGDRFPIYQYIEVLAPFTGEHPATCYRQINFHRSPPSL